jgi:hypothetical protein
LITFATPVIDGVKEMRNSPKVTFKYVLRGSAGPIMDITVFIIMTTVLLK